MSQGIHNVKDIVGDALKSSRLLKQGIIKGNWEKIVGKDLGRKTYVVGVKDRVLYVNTENPVMLHQLSFMKGTMLEEVNKFLEMEYIKDIMFCDSFFQNMPMKNIQIKKLQLANMVKYWKHTEKVKFRKPKIK